jgi:hypothetical protein
VVHLPIIVPSQHQVHTWNTNHVTNCLSRPPVAALTTVLHSCGHEAFEWPQIYRQDPDFVTAYKLLCTDVNVTNFHFQYGVLCHLGHLCVLARECAKLIWEAYYSCMIGHFGIEKTVAILHKHFYWPKLRQDIIKYIISFTTYTISKTTIKKQGLYTPLPTVTHQNATLK